MATHTKRKRRILRFSIRTLLIVLTIFCVALGWKVERARKQREAVAWVHEMGGSVNYDYELDDDGSSAPDAKPPGSEWLRKQLGRDFFDDVVRVSLTEVGVSDVTPLSGLRGSSSNRTKSYAKQLELPRNRNSRHPRIPATDVIRLSFRARLVVHSCVRIFRGRFRELVASKTIGR